MSISFGQKGISGSELGGGPLHISKSIPFKSGDIANLLPFHSNQTKWKLMHLLASGEVKCATSLSPFMNQTKPKQGFKD